jgi:hypothetical protein
MTSPSFDAKWPNVDEQAKLKTETPKQSGRRPVKL